jgi:hypothetical protein
VGHSQGALIVAQALQRVVKEQRQAGFTAAEVEAKLAHIRIETYGGGAGFYVDGPQYLHVDNHLDPVSQFLGLGAVAKVFNPVRSGGRGAVFKSLNTIKKDWNSWFNPGENAPSIVDRLVHGPRSIYFPVRVSFEEARRAGGPANV